MDVELGRRKDTSDVSTGRYGKSFGLLARILCEGCGYGDCRGDLKGFYNFQYKTGVILNTFLWVLRTWAFAFGIPTPEASKVGAAFL